jgi:hypothetical protein
MLTRAQLTGSVNPVLTEHARRLRPDGFVADEIFPRLQKPGQESGQIQVWDESNLEIPGDMVRAVGAPASIGHSAEPSYMSYTTKRIARKALITRRELDVYAAHGQDPDMLRASRVNKLVDQIMLHREQALASKLSTSANFESSYSTSLGTTWADDGGDPIGDIETGIKQMASGGVYPNVAVMDYQVWVTLARHSALLEMAKYVNEGAITEQIFMKIFNLRPVVSRAIYSSSGTKTPVWQDSCVLAYVNPGLAPAGESDMTVGRTIVSKDFLVTEYDAPEFDQDGAQWIECEFGYTHEFIGVDNATDGDTVAAYLIDNAI